MTTITTFPPVSGGLNTDNYYNKTEVEALIASAGGGAVSISGVADNRLEMKPDGLYVRDRLDPDPVAYYLLSRG